MSFGVQHHGQSLAAPLHGSQGVLQPGPVVDEQRRPHEGAEGARFGQIRRVENIGHDMPVLGTGEALGLLAGQLDSLEGHIGDLYQRLGPVLAPPGPEGAQPYCQAPTDSDIPAAIVGYSNRLRTLNDGIIELKGRLRL